MKKSLATIAATVALVATTAVPAQALDVSDVYTCPSDRFVVTSGSALGYVWVKSGSRQGYGTSTTNNRAYATVKSYRSKAIWIVSSGAGDNELPLYSNTCSAA